MKILIGALTIYTILISCNRIITIKDSGNQYKSSVSATKSHTTSVQNDVPYTIAEHYFVKNTFNGDHFVEAKITSQADFDKLFGAAAVMGADGKPTIIDFTKQYVIAVTEKETDVETTLIPESLTKVRKNIVLKYKIKRGGKTTFTMRPFLMLVVDKKHQGKVKVESSEVK